ncbi:uncharacterized protein PSANT_03600 [Moesziomyces antarcticus]|nr:uncharacterized protein PSANT_03600 [Moesziomyces antarcticus]
MPRQSPQRNTTIDDERLARAAAAQPPTPPRRQLRARKAAQLNPYTLEAVRYQRALIRNDWEDAVVSQREWHRQERRRLAEEAARAQRDDPAAQGSGESQSQWLVPGSDPSSQAEYEADLTSSSQSVPTAPQVIVEIPVLGRSDFEQRQAGGSRSRGVTPSSSQAESLPDLAEILAKAARTTTRPSASADRAGEPGVQTTYKGARSAVLPADRPETQASDNSVQEQESGGAPILVPSRRKHPLRALSPSDTEDNVADQATSPRVQATVTIESSEDERPAPKPTTQRSRRRSRWSGNGSSSDSTDYERRFRQLKRMMPAGMARKHIRDLRAMRHGKAYHSDGHVSSSSTDNVPGHTANQNKPPVMPEESDDKLQPGQTRKRLRRHDSADNALLIDPDSESDSSSASTAPSRLRSLSPEPIAPRLRSPSPDSDEAEEMEEAPVGWWSVHRLESRTPFRERDAIDRMLSRTAGRKPSTKKARSQAVHSVHRQARLDGFLSHERSERQSGSKRSQLREIDQNRAKSGDTRDKDEQRARKKRRKTKKLDPRVGRTSSARQPGGAPIELRNPPVVRPRVKPRLDLERHDLLFARDPVKTLESARRGGNDKALDGFSSDDDEPWQVLSSLAQDGAAALPDARLAKPRNRPMALPTIREGEGTPLRNSLSSPSVSVASVGVTRINADAVRSPSTPTRALPPGTAHIPHQNLSIGPMPPIEAKHIDTWDDFEGISLDFGIAALASGQKLSHGASDLFARIQNLVALPERLLRREPTPRTWRGEVLRLDDTTLSMDMDADALSSNLPFYVDSLRLQISRMFDDAEDKADAARLSAKLVSDTGAFLGCWLVRCAQAAFEARRDAAALFACYRTMLERIEQLQTSILAIQQRTDAAKKHRNAVCLQLAWMRFELCWRAVAVCDAEAAFALEPEAPTVESLLAFARALMAVLLHHGLHRSVRALRNAVSASDDGAEGGLGTQDAAPLDDAASMWVGVIHLLDSFEKSRGIADGRLFWTQFEQAHARWDSTMQRAPLLRAESLWYCTFAMPLFSQISPSGSVQLPLLRECWSAVARALGMLRFRTDEASEISMGWHVLARRDAYVRIVLQRCCLLVSEWRWGMDGADLTLARLFDIFNSHKLADLPTETEHDFPAFLRDFDVRKLEVAVDREAREDPSFHLFVRLLARAGHALRLSVSEAKEGDRKIARLFSRMTPVRVMPFTRTDVPTSAQRSVLFNHYAVVMLLLHLVPASSPQRLRQIQSFLPAFGEADFTSQVTNVRAMMYVAVEFRHHRLDLAPVVKWFGDTITSLRKEYGEIDRIVRQHDTPHGGQRVAAVFENAPKRQAVLRRKEEVARLLVVALRSIQHVIRHADLEGAAAKLPDQQLLHPAWTHELLAAQIALEPRIGQEGLKCIQTFLLARIRAFSTSATHHSVANNPTSNGGGGGEDSQDSFAELFDAADDDFDFEDPLLARLLDGTTDTEQVVSTAVAEAEERKQWDREFGDLVKVNISPALFQLLSNVYHPDARVVMGLGVTERLGTDTARAGASTRMAQLIQAAEARQFLELVVDCWAGCAQVLVANGLRAWSSYLGFGNESWKRIDHAVGRRDVALRFMQNLLTLDPGALDRKEYEVECVAVWIQTAVARVLSVQNVFTVELVKTASSRYLALLPSLTARWSEVMPDGDIDLDTFADIRPRMLDATLTWIATELRDAQGTAHTVLSALLSALRAYVEDAPNSSAGAEYVAFANDTLSALQQRMQGAQLSAALLSDVAQAKQVIDSRLHPRQ